MSNSATQPPAVRMQLNFYSVVKKSCLSFLSFLFAQIACYRGFAYFIPKCNTIKKQGWGGGGREVEIKKDTKSVER